MNDKRTAYAQQYVNNLFIYRSGKWNICIRLFWFSFFFFTILFLAWFDCIFVCGGIRTNWNDWWKLLFSTWFTPEDCARDWLQQNLYIHFSERTNTYNYLLWMQFHIKQNETKCTQIEIHIFRADKKRQRNCESMKLLHVVCVCVWMVCVKCKVNRVACDARQNLDR